MIHHTSHLPTRRGFFLTALATTLSLLAPNLAVKAHAAGSTVNAPGVVYVASNDVTANMILTYTRDQFGQLKPAGKFATGGKGTGTGLGNQGGLVLSDDGRFLLVVNAASNDISTLAITGSALKPSLRLIDKKPSGGLRPTSIAVSDNLVYVVNAGGALNDKDNISGFHLSRVGKLTAIPNSARPLSADNSGPAQISFNPEGDVLLVTEKATNKLTTFTVGQGDLVTSQQSHNSSGATPFGFAFSGRGKVFISNAAGAAVGAGSVSSYFVDETGSAVVLESEVNLGPSTAAPCWVVINKTGTVAYVTNTQSKSISRLALGSGGSVDLIENVITGAPDKPADMALCANDHFLYARNGGNQSLSIYTVQADGSLVAQSPLTGLPVGANGLVAR